MAQPRNRGEPADLPLGQMFRDYLDRQVEAQTQGLGFAVTAGEVSPYDPAPVQPVDPKLAWDEACGVLKWFTNLKSPIGLPVPPDWPVLVAGHEPAVSLAFCLGNFPQLVRTVQPLLSPDPASSRPRLAPAQGRPELTAWARRQSQPAHVLVAAGALRLAKDFTQAENVLGMLKGVPAEWAPVLANEKAALAWHAGRCEEALAQWQGQEEALPVLFNRGMALLFLGRGDEARGPLLKAAAGLPDSSSWHHLAQLYLAMGRTRS